MNAEPELRLLLEQHALLPQPRPAYAAVGSVAAHLMLALAVVAIPWPETGPRTAPRVVAILRSTPLVAPPSRPTQREPNRGPLSDEVNLQGLLARRSPAPLPPAPSPTRPAAPETNQAPLAPAPKPLIESPPVEPQAPKVPDVVARNLPGVGMQPLPPPEPPRIEPVEKPKVTFETPRAQVGAPTGTGRLLEAPRQTSVEDAARVITGGSGGLTVGDIGAPSAGGLGEALSGAPGLRNASQLELLSDPMGADFRPYLIQILSTVRRNWLAVLPQSARLGRRGRVQIQFAISRNGSVPKLVIALPSGTEALDRAAVAGISASNPFPPLPTDFRGSEVRLQFTFLYNIASR